LSGLLFDDAGHPMIATHATKNGVRYRYYVSQPHLRGLAKTSSSSVARVPATDIEAAVVEALAGHLGKQNKSSAQKRIDPIVVGAHVERIDVRKNQLAVRLKLLSADEGSNGDQDPDSNLGTDEDAIGSLLLIPWCKPPSRRAREILLPPSATRHTIRPIKVERRAALLKSIARGREWLDQIISGAAQGPEQIASSTSAAFGTST
jgi:site-specific DNA recombinase